MLGARAVEASEGRGAMGPWVCPVPCCGGFIGVLQVLTITTAHLKPSFLELGLPPWKR